jgi:hypothetical protein
MEAKTLTPEADADPDAAAAAPQTLAAGELVWAKPSMPRRHCWWPARMLAACPASATRGAQVSYFSDPAAPGAPSAPPAQVRRFADADAGADMMARGSTARGFSGAVAEAEARAVAALRAQLACACVPPTPPPGEDSSVTGVANLAPAEFLAALREAALDVFSAGLLDRARLKSWVRAVGEGWGPHGARHYPRRPLHDLVDKIDLDVPAGEDRDADGWLAEDQHKALERPEETPLRHKKRGVTKVLDAGEDEGKMDSPEHVTSGKRQRKRSKYLLPPYTSLVVVDKIALKPVDLPRALVTEAAEDGSDMSPLPDSIVVEDVLLLVRRLGEVPRHKDDFPKDAEGFLCLFRSTTFVHGADYESCKAYECPLVRGSGKVGMEIVVALASDSHAFLNQGSCVLKRTRKKDEAVSGSPSIKKKREKTSLASADIPIAPAIPIRQLKAEDMRTLMKAESGLRGIGLGVKNNKGKPSPLKVPISAADPGAVELGHEHAQANVLAVCNTFPEQPAKENDATNLEATRSEMNMQNGTVDVPIRSVQTEAMKLQANNPIDVNAQSVAVDVPVGSVSKEATEPETSVHKDKNVQSDVSGVSDRIVSKEPTESETDDHINENVQSVAADMSSRSVSKEAAMTDADIGIHENTQSAADLPDSSGPSPMHEDMSQPVDGHKEPGSVEVCIVQQSYASLEAMVPEMLKKANANGAGTIGVNYTLKDEFQKDGQPVEKVKLPAEVANHSCGGGTNGTWLDPANLTPKKRKKVAQHFSNPAAVIVEFAPGATVPSRQELLSTFGKYGDLIESQTDISETTRSASVVYGKSVEAEEAYRNGCQYLLGQFGPPFATLRLDFSPIVPSPSPPASKPPLRDIRKNLEDMISSRRSALNKATSSADAQLDPVPDKLLGEMQGLLAKVDRMLTRPHANAP